MSTIITVATMKGGSGKSTLASCLAVHWHLRGRHPTLIDADPQRSIMRLAARERNSTHSRAALRRRHDAGRVVARA